MSGGGIEHPSRWFERGWFDRDTLERVVGGRDRQFLYFFSSLGERLLPIEEIVEILPMLRLEHDDAGDRHCLGLLYYRGRMVPVFQVQASSGDLDVVGTNLDSYLVIVRHDDREFAFVAIEIFDIVTVDADAAKTIEVGGGRSLHMVHIGERFLRVLSAERMADEYGLPGANALGPGDRGNAKRLAAARPQAE